MTVPFLSMAISSIRSLSAKFSTRVRTEAEKSTVLSSE